MTDDKQVKLTDEMVELMEHLKTRVTCDRSDAEIFFTLGYKNIIYPLKALGYCGWEGNEGNKWELTDAGRAALEAHKDAQQEQFRSYRRNEVEATEAGQLEFAKHMFMAGHNWASNYDFDMGIDRAIKTYPQKKAEGND